MANVTDSSSLLVVPSGWSDGVLGSLKPDDGSGDFTFSRGSDLSATRVNEDGYIEKGYENLYLQSNSFDVAPWSIGGPNYNLTGGQAGYDGSNDAWFLEKITTNNSYFSQSVVLVGSVYTVSIRAKANSANSGILLFFGTPYLNVNLETKSVYDRRSSIFDSVTDIGNGWVEIVFTFKASQTSTNFQLVTNNLTGQTGSIYIQDFQIIQGLTAQPYLETTTTTAKAATISEDQPRIDYTSGNGALLIEPSATNSAFYSEYFSGYSGGLGTIEYDDSILNPSNNYGVYKHNVDQTKFTYNIFGLSVGQKVTYSIFAKSFSTSEFWFGGMFGGEYATFNVVTGSVVSQGSAVNSAYSVDYGNGWRRFVVSITFSSPLGNNLSYLGFRWRDNVNYVYLWGLQAEFDSTSASSYIPTYGTTATRAKDTATLTKNVAATGTIYININADSAKILTFLGGNVSVTQGVNKIALAYSPTALKISHNGSIVQNIARSFDTSSLTEIQLGHRNNFEQTTDSINQFLTLDSFLTDTELNELTA